jgi:hypothetical protein
MCFFNSAEQAYGEQNQPLSNKKIVICRKYFFKNKLNSHRENNVTDAAATNIDGFHWRDTCLSSTQRNRPIWSKHSISPP